MKDVSRAHGSGRDHYEKIYDCDLNSEAQWLKFGAIEKATSIELLLNAKAIRPSVLMELGCGTGAVILECQRRNLAERYIGVEYSSAAIEFLRRHSSEIQIENADLFAELPKAADVVVLSHVLEHLEEPAACLINVGKQVRGRWRIAEVPLENLLAGRMKAFLGCSRGAAAGHVQFFSAASFERLMESSGYKIVCTRRYLPLLTPEMIRFQIERGGLRSRRRATIWLLSFLLPRLLKALWSRLYYAHFAVLAHKRQAADAYALNTKKQKV